MKPTLLVTLFLFCLFNFDAYGQSLNIAVAIHNNVKEGIASLEHHITETSGSLETHLELANAYYLKEDFSKAVAHYEYYLASQDFAIPEFYYTYAKALEQQQEPTKAMAMFKIAEQLNNTILASSSVTDENGVQVLSISYQVSEFEANGVASDFSPSGYGDQIVFASHSAAQEQSTNAIDPWTGRPSMELYVSIEDREQKHAEAAPFVIDQVKELRATTAFTED